MRRAKRQGMASDSAPDAPRSQPPRWVVWALVVVLALAAITDLIFYMGFVASDDLTYSHGAIQIAQTGRLTFIHAATIRLGIVLPLALVARVSHQNWFAMTACFILGHLLVIVGTYWVGRLVHNHVTGMVAAGFMAVCPLACIFAGMIFPDHAATALILLSTGAVLTGSKSQNAAPQSGRAHWALAGAGFLFGLSLMAKEVGLIALPALLALVGLSTRKPIVRYGARSALIFLAGLAVACLFYEATFRVITGLWSPFQSRPYVEKFWPAHHTASVTYTTPADRLRRLVWFGASKGYMAAFRWALPLSLIVYPFLKRRSWFVYLTFLWLCAYMTWGTFSLSRYRPPPMQIRYFILPLPFLMIMAANTLTTAGARIWRRAGAVPWLRHACYAVVALAGIAVIVSSYRGLDTVSAGQFWSREMAGMRYALDFASNNDHRPVVLSYWLSVRAGVTLPENASYLVRSTASTSLEDVEQLLPAGGFLYLESAYEQGENRRGVKELSPLDSAIRDALAGHNPSLSVTTVAVFPEFTSRSAALRYVYGGVRDGFGLRQDTRCVFLREIGPPPRQAEMLADNASESLDLSHRDAWGPTWVSRVGDCRVRRAEDGSVVCDIVGSNITSGGQYGGISFATGPVEAVRLDVTFDTPETIGAVFMDLTSGTATRRRLRWQFTPSDQVPLPAGGQTYTFRPGRSAGPFAYAGGPISLQDCDRAHLFVRLKGVNSRAAFRVHRVLVQRPAR